MAAETEDTDEPRKRPKLGENCKVYVRRNQNKAPDNKCNTINVNVSSSDNTFTSPENRYNNTTAVNINNNKKEINKKSDTVPQNSPQSLATEEANLSQRQQAQPVHNEPSIQEKQADYVRPTANTTAIKPLLTRFENRIWINLKSGRPKNEILELKSKLSNELDQVRGVVSRLEDKEEVLLSSQPAASSRLFRSYGGKQCGKKGGHVSAVDKYISKSFKGCSDLLTRLMKHKHSWLFNKPVDVEKLKLYDYYDVIKNPMDLGTIKSRLTKHSYKSPIEFAEDVRLTFNNSMTYNPKGHEVYGMAEELLKIFEGKWPAIESDYNLALRHEKAHNIGLPIPTSRSRDMGLNTPTMVPSDSKLVTNERVGGAPVLKNPEEKDLNKRNMTSDEKQKLTADLESLPSEKVPDIVQIIKKRNSVSQHDEEIELDIEALDAETLWELNMFVSNFKRIINKQKRKAEIAYQTESVSNPHVSTEIPSPSNTKSVQRSNIGARSDANPTSDQEREGDGIGSSSSSSSDLDSSSSDSDGDSSSSNGSERGGLPMT